MTPVASRRVFFIVVVLATVAISGSLVFLGYMIGNRSQLTPVDEDLLAAKVREEVTAQLKDKQLMDPLVQAAIVSFVERQRQAQVATVNERIKNVRRVSITRDHVFGAPDAPISLIEYSDFECPYCKGFHETAKKIVAAYGGKVNWVYRHFPLGFHNPGAQKEAEASECAAEIGGNDAFWRYADLIYARTKSNGKGFPLDNLVPLAKEIGLDEAKFKACLDSGRMAARVGEDFTDGEKAGVTGTPGNILLNNKTGEARLRPGARPFEAFKTDLDQMLQ
ncbi:MAG: DsbA family protein [Gammaproteobacteria bacterium]|nr:DsbA family protein [Gammaproteobacteria bacterium]MDH5511966.1 DsbA family protein [Gammaproteobacteria bacterium]